MAVLRFLWRLLTARWLWIMIGVALLCAAIWVFGPLLSIGEATPLADETTRLIAILVIVVIWGLINLVAQGRARQANKVFVEELAAAPAPKPGEEEVAAVSAKFQSVLEEMKRRKLAGRKFLRELPWYVIIGPPATGKTTALRQSGLDMPIDLSDDLSGVGGTRNCDWFFTEQAVLIDTAGRYALHESRPDVDAAEWLAFLDLLRKHRGRRALNGVILAISTETLAEGDSVIRAHGRELRRRLSEIYERLEMRLPVYLMVTKADLVRGFVPFFGDLSTREREQVWGATFPPGTAASGEAAARELELLTARLEEKLVPRLEQTEDQPERAEIFRFPACVQVLTDPLRLLVDAVFGESRYEQAPWLRGVYFTSATQEGTPIDQLVGQLAASYGLARRTEPPSRPVERRSYFLHDLLAKVIFPEAGLATYDPAAEARRRWLWRGALAGAAAMVLLATLSFTIGYLESRQAVAAQASAFEELQVPLDQIGSRHVSTDAPDLFDALAAVQDVAGAALVPPASPFAPLGPDAEAEMLAAQEIAYERALRNVLEPRMVALAEATLLQKIRDPEFVLEALKVYKMLTGQAPYDEELVAAWWFETLPETSPIGSPFPSEIAAQHQLAAIERLRLEADKIAPDEALISDAVRTICSVPLNVRAHAALMNDPAVRNLERWVPAEEAGPKALQVLTRRSGKTLHEGIPGPFTYDGFHGTILARAPEIAAEALKDRQVFEGGCRDSSEADLDLLVRDMLKLYYDDYIAEWEGFLADVTLAPLNDRITATENLKDLSGADSTLKRLLTAIVAQTELDRVEEEEGAGGAAAQKGAGKALSKLGKLGKLAKTGMKVASKMGGGEEEVPGRRVAVHFADLKNAVLGTESAPPALDDAMAALQALSSQLQTISASPDPDGALVAQGGLGALTGAVANEAAALPEPLDNWLIGVAADTQGFSSGAMRDELNAIWRADVLPFCHAALAGRYPFEPGSRIDVNIADFQRLFAPGGMIDGFTNQHLMPLIDTAGPAWKWRSDVKLDPDALAAFQQARTIRDSLFASGSGPSLAFVLQPVDLAPSASRVMLDVDGQELVFYNNAQGPVAMTWPGPDGANLVTLAFTPVDGSAQSIIDETGAWGWLRMMRKGGMQTTNLPELFRLRLEGGGHWAEFTLRAASVENPFDLSMFRRFTCPERL
ncbi:MAG TPA: type VI secretion system membrane subunit TssM [Thermohalobaculum sp.]|nr:type VI secretion system membrane subunit TssM [Thermohalobaculum sp.]